MSPKEINELIQRMPEGYNKGDISDGYHTIDELYAHRIELYIALCRVLHRIGYDPKDRINGTSVWRSKRHSDGELAFGGEWFLLGITLWKYDSSWKIVTQQITYHLPIKYWDECKFLNEEHTPDQAPEFDGHTSEDVLERLKLL